MRVFKLTPTAPKRRRHYATIETGVTNVILAYLHHRGIFAWKQVQAGIWDPVRNVYKGFHGLRGVSDILGVLPNGKFLAVEVKSPSGRVSEEQERFIAKVNELGGRAIIARSIEDVKVGLNGVF